MKLNLIIGRVQKVFGPPHADFGPTYLGRLRDAEDRQLHAT